LSVASNGELIVQHHLILAWVTSAAVHVAPAWAADAASAPAGEAPRRCEAGTTRAHG
jgi:hypothetical protein